jgi:integrase
MAAAEHYAAHLERQKAIQGSLSIADALDQWSGSYRLKSRSRRTLSEIESYAGRFKNGFHGMKLGELDKISLHSFLENYLTDTGKPPTDQTRVNLRTKLGQFCEFCRLKGWMEQNPIQNVPITRPKNGRVEILAIGKAAALMEAASQKDPATGMVPYFAVCLFAGLRPEEAKGLKWEDIDLAQKQIFVRAETSKTRQDRYVTIEDNLWQWLTASRRKKGPIVGPNYRRNFDSVREQAGFWIWRRTKKQNSKDAPRWTDDIMRHSYASYWLAVHHDRAKLAEQMGNSLAVIRQHYRKAILQSEGKSYWTILPS